MSETMASEKAAPQTPVKGVKSHSTFDKSTTSSSFSEPYTPQSSPESPPDYIFSPPDSVHTTATEDYGWDTPTRKPASAQEHSTLQVSSQSPLSQSKSKKHIFSSKITVSKTKITSWLRSASDILTIKFDPSDNEKESNFTQVKEEPDTGLTLGIDLSSEISDPPERENEVNITDANEPSNLQEENDEPAKLSDPRIRPPKNFIPLDRVITRRHSMDLGRLGLKLQEKKEEYRGRSRSHSEHGTQSAYLQGHPGLSPIPDVLLHRVGPTIKVIAATTPPDATPYVKAETPSSRLIATPATDGRVRASPPGQPSTPLKRPFSLASSSISADVIKIEGAKAPVQTGTHDTPRPHVAIRKSRSAENLVAQSGASALYSTSPDNQIVQGGAERAKSEGLFTRYLASLANGAEPEAKRPRLEQLTVEEVTQVIRKWDGKVDLMGKGEYHRTPRSKRSLSVHVEPSNSWGSNKPRDSAEVHGENELKEHRGRPRSKSDAVWQCGSNTTLSDGPVAESGKSSPDARSDETEDVQYPERSLAEILSRYIRHSLEENESRCLGITVQGRRCRNAHQHAPTPTINDPDDLENGGVKEFTSYIKLIQSTLCKQTHITNATKLSFWQRLLGSNASNASIAQIKSCLVLILKGIPGLVDDCKIVDDRKTTRSAKEYIWTIQNLKPWFPDYQQGVKLNELLERIITRPIKSVTEKNGRIYMYWRPGDFGHAKIGLSENINKRLKDWEYKCKKKLYLHYPKQTDNGSLQRVPHIYRVETLIHAELRDYRQKEFDCPGCHKTHEEWFQLNRVVTKDVVVEIIEKWMGWMRQQPYVQRPKADGTGVEWVLKDDMRKTLKDVCRPHEQLSAIKRASVKERKSDVVDWSRIFQIDFDFEEF